MARPAFRPSYWQNYPPPFYPGASGRYPVPGWGVRPVMAGPARVGVGALGVDLAKGQSIKLVSPSTAQLLTEQVAEEQKAKVPSYVWWMAGAFALGGAVALARGQGWLGGKKRR